MNVVLENEVTKKVSNKILLKMWGDFFRTRMIVSGILFSLSTVILLLLLAIGDYKKVIYLTIPYACCLFGCLFKVIGVTRKYVKSASGIRFEFTDKNFKVGEKECPYSIIEEVVLRDEYLIMRRKKFIIPIIITEDNRHEVNEVARLVKNKILQEKEGAGVSGKVETAKVDSIASNYKQQTNEATDLVKNEISDIKDRDVLAVSNVIEQDRDYDNKLLRSIWNVYAPIRTCIMLFVYFVLLLVIETEFVIGKPSVGVIASLILGILVSIRYIRIPKKVEKKIKRSIGDRIIFDETNFGSDDKKYGYGDIKKVIVKQRFIIIKMKRNKLILAGSNAYIDNVHKNLFGKCGNSAVFADKKKAEGIMKLIIYAGAALSILLLISNIEERINYNEIVDEYRTKFESKYGIELLVLEETQYEDGYTIFASDSKKEVLNALEDVGKMLERFPEQIFDEFDWNIAEGVSVKDVEISLIMSGDIERDVQSNAKSDVTGLTHSVNEEIRIYISCNGSDAEETFCHEMFHAIEKRYIPIIAEDGVDLTLWNTYNPPQFTYLNDNSTWLNDDSYTDKEKNIDEVYFVTSYSKKDIHEDMADIFGYLVSSDDELPDAFNSPHVEAKAKYLIQWIDDNFECVTDDVYWNKWYK